MVDPEKPESPRLTAMLIERIDPSEGVVTPSARDWTLTVHYQFDTEVDSPWMGWYFGTPVNRGVNIDAQIEETFARSSTYSDGFTPSLTFAKMIVRLGISVAFFGVDRHELVAPDIPRCYVEKYRNAQQAGDKSEAARVLEAAKHMGMFGWRVGSEMDLPAPDVRYLDKAENGEPGRSLEYGHVRRGHMRLQPCGTGHKERRLQFIPPALVRPDLPLAETHGFRIGKPSRR